VTCLETKTTQQLVVTDGCKKRCASSVAALLPATQQTSTNSRCTDPATTLTGRRLPQPLDSDRCTRRLSQHGSTIDVSGSHGLSQYHDRHSVQRSTNEFHR